MFVIHFTHGGSKENVSATGGVGPVWALGDANNHPLFEPQRLCTDEVSLKKDRVPDPSKGFGGSSVELPRDIVRSGFA